MYLRRLSVSLHLYLPDPYALHPFPERPLEYSAEFERVTADLDHVVEQGTQSGQRERGREQRHVTKLDEHLQVVIKCPLVLEGRTGRSSVTRILEPRTRKYQVYDRQQFLCKIVAMDLNCNSLELY